METIATRFMKKSGYEAQVERGELRLGFHRPNCTSKDHLHMHIIMPPFKGTEKRQKNLNEGKYGPGGLVPLADVLSGNYKEKDKNRKGRRD